MRKRTTSKILSLLLAACMLFSLFPVSIFAEDTDSATWTKTTLNEITSEDTVAITMSKDGTTWVLPTKGNGSQGQPLAVTGTVEGTTLTTQGASAEFGWTVSKSDTGCTFSCQNRYLYVTATNNGVRIGTPASDNENARFWNIVDDYLAAQDSNSATRYLGVYTTSTDWRCYTRTSTGAFPSNIAGQELGFWKLTSTPTEPDEPTLVDISTALAASSGEFMVKGVVTMVDGANVFIQDATGGICLYFSAAPTGIELGDTVIGTGTRTTYKGLPELTGATFEKSSGLTLTAKDATIGALTTADICTYVQLKDLEVTEVYDNNGAYASPNVTLKDAEGKTIQIYKAVVGKTDGAWDLAAGDKVSVKAAVGVNNTTLQLRNTLASEITKASSGLYPEVDATKNVYELTAALADGDVVLVYNAGNTKALTSTILSNYYLEGKDFVPQTVSENSIIAATPDDAATSEWTVKVNEDGTYTFTQGDSTLAGKQVENGTKINNNLTLSAEDNSTWSLAECSAENNSYYMYNPGMTSKYADEGAHIYLEWYAKYNEFSLYDTSRVSEDVFGMTFFKLVRPATEEPPAPEYDTIASALAASSGDFTVKGVVTLVDGKNIYVQDETGGICLYFGTAPTDISLGDTVIGTGTRGAYNGLPELTGATYTKSEGLTLTAKNTTLAEITNADICTYVTVKNLTVTAVSGSNTTVADESGTTMTLFKAVADPALAVGDQINFTGAVGIYNSALQLRNTLAKEISRVSDAKTGLVTDLADLTDGSYVVIYNPYNKLAMTSETYRDWYLLAGSASAEDGQINEPAANQVWKVTVNSDGTYTFTQSNYSVAAWLDGNYVELTNNGSYNADTDTTWTLDVCNAENSTFYMSSGKLSTTYGKAYVEVYTKKVNNESTLVFCGYSTSPDKLTENAYGMQFYLVPEPEAPQPVGDLVTSLSQLTDGTTVAIYSPGHKTAISTKPNGDWYLKANPATVEEGKVVNFTADYVWKVKANDNGTYSFYANDDESHSITVWASGTYAELSLNVGEYPDNTWTLTPAKTANCFYMSSPTVSGDRGPAYVEAYLRNEWEVFSGYFTKSTNSNFKENEFALQFYLVNPDDAIEAYDDGEWDGVLEKGKQYVAYNDTAASAIGLFAEANYSMRAIPTTIENEKANAGNGAYVFTVDSMGRYYSFMINGKYFATNASEELLFVDPNEDGSAPENAKWLLVSKNGGYIIYNKDAYYNGTPVCVEYYSSVFSGWTFSTKNDVGIYLFNFYEVADGTEIREGVVQAPSIAFDCEDFRYVEQDYDVSFSLDDLAPGIESIQITYTAGAKTGTVTEYEASEDGKAYHFTIPAADIDQPGLTEFTVTVTVNNSYAIQYTGQKTVEIIDKPFFEDLTPAPNAQTRDDKRPVISARVGNVGDAPTFTMTINGQAVEAVFENGVLSYTPAEDLADGRTTVVIKAVRADGVEAEKSWTFIVGTSGYQLYFGQLHSHTTYSDGSGSLDTALDYIASLPESANVQFVAFTDHSNYFDTTSASNPADALNNKSLMTDASRALWDEYKSKVSSFNEAQAGKLLAIAGFEMTWSGGPGHINTFDSDGLVSRNNADLNNKNDDAGMKLYYETINKGESLNQFNHPGSTFGNFTDFSYWDEETDAHMFLVEVGNGEGQIGAGGYYPSYEQYVLALDKGWHVAPTNNQDNHKGRWGNANDARDVILTNDFSEQGIYDAIRALRVYATEDKNLQISYTVNGEPMGTIFTDENAPETLNMEVTLYDPDATDSISKVELIVDGGATAYTWDDAQQLAEGSLTAELGSQYSYYYVRVTQKDGDLAVTAPVWVGNALKLGIDGIKASAEPVYKGEEAVLVTTLHNNEAQSATVKSLVYSVGGTVIGTDSTGYTIPAGGTLDAEFVHTFDTAKLTTVTVTAIVTFEGKDYTFTANVELDVLDKEAEGKVSTIAEVRAASDPNDTGYRFVIEGVVTSNASGYDKDTAFFDCIYVQDETGGICCFPVSGEYKIGDKVRIVGHTDFYQSEPELQVQTIEIIGSGSVEPTEITAAQLNDRSAEGKLVTIKGTVESFELANGLIQTIMVKDAAGGLARVFIDGYITTAKDVENCVVGTSITVTGLASYDDTFDGPFPRIRIRDRADVICAAGYQIIVENYAGEKAVTSLAEGMSYVSGEVTFTVTCDEACLIAVKNTDGTYTVLPCTDADGAHTFTVTVADADVNLAIALKGDADLNGTVETRDATLVKQKVLATAAFEVDENLQTLAGDAFPDGNLSAKDATAIKQVVLGTRTLVW